LNEARHDVGAAAGRETDEQPHRPRRIGLRARDPRECRQRRDAGRETKKLPPL